jgi:hypothetical protein
MNGDSHYKNTDGKYCYNGFFGPNVILEKDDFEEL